MLLLALIVLVATRPAEFKIERSAELHAPPEAVFPLINDFHRWGEWSPWEKLDPNMQRTFEGPTSGVGASYAWNGEKAGAGKMTIIESQPAKKIGLDLAFTKPMEAQNPTTFTLEPSGQGTRVTWSMTGKNNFLSKAFSLVANMDKLVGADFEKGLASLDTAAQAEAKRAAATQSEAQP